MANKSSASSAFLVGTSTGGSYNRASQASSSVPNQNQGGSRGTNNTNRRHSRRGKFGSGSTSSSANVSGGSPIRPGWPTVFNPWTGSIQLWSGPSTPRPASGLLGPRPAVQHSSQQAFVAEGLGGMQQPPAVTEGFKSMQPPFSGGHSGMLPLTPGSYNGMHSMQPHVSGVQSPFGGWPAVPSSPGVLRTPYLGWDQNMLAHSFNTMTLHPPNTTEWYLDSGATSHMTSDAGSSLQERDRQVQ